MPTPEDKQTHAAHLYLMAADAFAWGDCVLAQLFIAKANQYADEAVALAEAQTIVQQQQRAETETAGKLGER
jgi:hypothetical protein